MISVLLVDDSPVAILVLKKMLQSFSDIQIVGTARHGEEALELIPRLRPQVICSDLHMPRMDGLQLTKEVMMRHPLPILVISVSVQQSQDDHNIFELLEAGAIDVFPKPRGGLESCNKELSLELATKIRILSGVIPIRRHQRTAMGSMAAPVVCTSHARVAAKMVIIGASTGGPQALLNILSELPKHFPVPILCVQHISRGFIHEMVNWLNANLALTVKIARSGEALLPGCVYFPQEDNHFVFGTNGLAGSLPCGEGDLHCPSIDVAFASAAACFREALIAVLLTGMGRDGAQGMRTILDAGGCTLAQNEATCVVFGMPAQAIALGGVREVLPLSSIASALIRQVER